MRILRTTHGINRTYPFLFKNWQRFLEKSNSKFSNLIPSTLSLNKIFKMYKLWTVQVERSGGDEEKKFFILVPNRSISFITESSFKSEHGLKINDRSSAFIYQYAFKGILLKKRESLKEGRNSQLSRDFWVTHGRWQN